MKNMKKSTIILIAVAAVVALLVIWAISSYNGLVSAEEGVNNKFAEIQTQLQRRTDLIPNLVNTVKGYAAHEEEIYTALADARAKMMGANTMDETIEADAELSSALSRLMVVVENYPELKANENFINLQDELAGTENRIQKARQNYNDAATAYNAKIRKFPSSIMAGIGGFEKVELFKAAPGAENAPTVEF